MVQWYENKSLTPLSQQAAREVMDGIPHREEAYGHDGEKDNDDIPGVDADGIGVDDKRALAAAQRDDTVGLLYPAQKKAHSDAENGSYGRYESALKEEYLCDLFVAGSQVT